MTDVLLDSNVLLRLLAEHDPQHERAHAAVAEALREGHRVCLAPQVLMECWVVLTRPRTVNGFEWTVEASAAALDDVRARLPVLPELPEVFDEWRRLVLTNRVTGKHAHDARLVAWMHVHGIQHVITFNRAHFASFDGVVVLPSIDAQVQSP